MNETFRAEMHRPAPPIDANSQDPPGVRDPGRIILTELHGQLDRTAVDEMTVVRSQVTEDVDVLVLDLGAVTYINSTGIALLVQLLAEARTAAVEVRVCGLTDHYQHIFEITRMVDLMACFPDTASAVAGATPVT